MDFHYNHSDESQDVSRSSAFQRDEIAYTLWKAETAPSWQIDDASMFDTITLGKLDETNATQALKQKMTQYALDQLGYPYIWGGEWNAKTGDGYCCGSQPQGGMDCSGFVWWTVKAERRRLQRRPVPSGLQGLVAATANELGHGPQHVEADHVRQPPHRRSHVLSPRMEGAHGPTSTMLGSTWARTG
jgi:hypothetical protein